MNSDLADQVHVARARFGDTDELAAGMSDWALDLRQIERGPMTSAISSAETTNGRVTRVQTSRRLHQLGATPADNRSFAILEPSVPSVRWCGHSISQSSIMVFPPSGEFEAISPSGFDAYALSFPETALERLASAMRLASVDALVGNTERVVTCAEATMRCLRRHVRAVHRAPTPLNAVQLLNEEIPGVLLHALATPAGEHHPEATSSRHLAIAHALELMHDRVDEPLTMPVLAAAAGVSWRTLDYAFRERFGVGPKRYLQALRLHGVRRDLRTAIGPRAIGSAANRWGFWHMGQFAADYRRLFGELPSDTLGRRARSRQ